MWTGFKKHQVQYQKRLHGDQDWLYEVTHVENPAVLFPDHWIQSWKCEVRQSRSFAHGGIRGNKKFEIEEHDAVPRVECCICVFHGDPQPSNVTDKWVVDNWK